ncbi:membrane protease YdiL (CAAX protease family) [Thermocatellispora tengchongensis]|uniref:Membrane protease YdiL (CAAX protease family) n=1 Tax=Thermocatellispora tengchongensis TaxID=1073253 RepID=A0A840P9N9_9ACTN|nr:type II CAAX endopeptidase family protein [Thermocatellispora tengchongensis]MBB5133917.1 membrane protease YdiL (CAAX protease family) [Thermocatellispora tengchongensis]
MRDDGVPEERPSTPAAQGFGPYAGPPPYSAAVYGAPPPRLPYTVGPPDGTRFDQLARTPLHRWWRPVLGAVMIVFGYVTATFVVVAVAAIVTGVLNVPLFEPDSVEFAEPVLGLALTLFSLAVAIPLVFVVTWLVQRRPPGTLSSVAGRLRWGWLLLCVPVALAAGLLGQLTAALVLTATGNPESSEMLTWVGWERFLPGLLVAVLLVPFQAAAEEYVFRGWLLQAFGAFLRNPWPGIVLGAAGFTALHAYTDWGIVDVFAFGVLMGWLAVRTGGLEAPIALHVVNNVLGFGISAASGTLDDALRQGSVPWETLTGTAVQLIVFMLVVLALARRRRVATLSPGVTTAAPHPINS